MAHACLLRFCHQIGRGCGEEVHHRSVGEVRRIENIDQHIGTFESTGETLAGEHVDAGTTGCGDDLVAVRGQPFDELCSDQAAGPDHCDLHAYYYPSWNRWKSMQAHGICAECGSMPVIGGTCANRSPATRWPR